MRRVLGAMGFTFFLCLAAANTFGFDLAFGAAAVLLVVSILLLFCPDGIRRISVFAFLSFGACVIYCLAVVINIVPLKVYDGRDVTLRAEVKEADLAHEDEYYSHYTLKALSGGDLPKGTTLRLSSSEAAHCLPGDIIECTAQVWLSDSSYLYSNGIFLNGTVLYDGDRSTLSVQSKSDVSLMHNLARFRISNAENIESILNKTASSVVNSVTFGSGYLDDELSLLFRSIGVSHLFAVSGLHTSIIGQTIMMFLSFFGIKRRHSASVAMVVVWSFVAMIGFPESAVRAALMFSIFSSGLILSRRSDPLNSLGFACAAITLFSPFAAADVGLLSSVLSCGGLILLSGPMYRLFACKFKFRIIKPLRFIISSICTCLSATVGLLPCIVLYYGSFSLVSPVANLFLVPMANILLIFSAVGCVFLQLPIVGILGQYVIQAAGFIAKAMVWTARLLSSLMPTSVDMSASYIAVWVGLSFVLAAAGVLLYKKTDRKRRAAVLTAVGSIVILLSGVVSHSFFDSLSTELIISDVNQGLAVTVRKGNKGVVIIGDGLFRGWTVYDDLSSRGVTDVKALLVSPECEPTQTQLLLSKIDVENIYELSDNTDTPLNTALTPWENCKIEYSPDDGVVLITFGDSRFAVITKECDLTSYKNTLTGTVFRSGETEEVKNIGGVFVASVDEQYVHKLSPLLEHTENLCCTAGEGSIIIRSRGNGDVHIKRMR